MTRWGEAALTQILESCRPMPSANPNILRTLLAIQERLGHVPMDAVSRIAQGLGVTETQVVGVLSYYPDLRTEATGRHLIRVCLGESCMANHGVKVLRAIRDHLGVDVGETTRGGRFTLEHVSCVGNCAVAPSVFVDGELCGHVTPSKIPSLLEPYR